MPKRNLTNPDATPDWSLSEQQQTAINLIVSGKNFQTVADAIAAQRPTVSHWVHHHPGFQAELNRRRQGFWADLVDGLESGAESPGGAGAGTGRRGALTSGYPHLASRGSLWGSPRPVA